MGVRTQLRQVAVGGDQVVAKPFRVRGGEPQPRQAGHLVDRLEQLDKRGFAVHPADRFAAVAGNNLAEQRHFFHPVRHQLLDFRHDLRDRPASFAAARRRHDAERTMHVAALHDADKRADGAVPVVAPHVVANGRLAAGFLADIDDRLELVVVRLRLRLAARKDLVEILRHPVKPLGANHQVNRRLAPRQLGAPALGHASHVPQHQVRFLPFQRGQHSHLAQRLLLGQIADATGIEQDHIGILFRGHQRIAAPGEHRRDCLAVTLVHLAAVGFDVDLFHRRGQTLGSGRIRPVTPVAVTPTTR